MNDKIMSLDEKPNEKMYDEFFYKYYSVITAYCDYRLKNTEAAKDIASEVFVALYSVWNTFSEHPETGIKVWLYKTADYMLKNHYRKKDNSVLSFEDFETVPDGGIETDEDEKFKIYITKIRENLTGEERLLFDCIAVRNYGYEKTAKLMKLSENAVKMRWYRLRERHREYINRLIEV